MEKKTKLVFVPEIGVEYRYASSIFTILKDVTTTNYGLYIWNGLKYDGTGLYYNSIEKLCLGNEKLLPTEWFSQEVLMEHGDRFKLKVGNTTTDYGILVEIVRGSNTFHAGITGKEDIIVFSGQPTLEELTRKIQKFVICHNLEIDN